VTTDSGNRLLGNPADTYKVGMAGWLAVCAALPAKILLGTTTTDWGLRERLPLAVLAILIALSLRWHRLSSWPQSGTSPASP
jgi:hypothetical protein